MYLRSFTTLFQNLKLKRKLSFRHVSNCMDKNRMLKESVENFALIPKRGGVLGDAPASLGLKSTFLGLLGTIRFALGQLEFCQHIKEAGLQCGNENEIVKSESLWVRTQRFDTIGHWRGAGLPHNHSQNIIQ